MTSDTLGITLATRMRQGAHVLAEDIGEEMVVVGARTDVYFGLDSIGSRIWTMLAQPRTLSEVCELLCRDYAVDPDECAAGVLEFAGGLHADGLLEVVT